MSLIYNATFDSQTRVLSLLDRAGHVISSCEVPSKGNVDDPNKPLMLRAIADNSSVRLEKRGTLSNTYQTSTDGTNWTDYTFGTEISLNNEDVVYFRCSNHPTTQTNSNFVRFYMSGKIEAWHNAYSMISSSFTDTSASVGSYGMFLLFYLCEGLTKAPLLLNALAEHCYDGMFYNCPSLKQAPSLPATTLADWCYYDMFNGCQSLKQAPSLPATTLAYGCYFRVFAYCSNLSEVRISATTTAKDALFKWLDGVSATGDFYCDPNAKFFPTGASGIPEGWRRIPPVDDPSKPLMLRAIEDNSTVTLQKKGTLSNTYQTSTDGTNWTDYTLGTQISLKKEDVVYFRCSNHPTTQTVSDYVFFSMTGKIEAWHNAYSMISSSFTSAGGSVGDWGLSCLFENCESLTKAPLLLNALAKNCYYFMFSGCSSLTKAPSLPATTLEQGCYFGMFNGCSSLTQAPSLSVTTLKKTCYSYMFGGCSKLNEVRIAADTTATNALNDWLSGVAASGTVYADPYFTGLPENSASGIPSGWSRKPLSDYPNP